MRKFPLATIPATDERIVKALSVDQEYLISVALPYHYHEKPTKTYPVIYVLDGNWYFGMVVDMVRIMNTRVVLQRVARCNYCRHQLSKWRDL